MIYASSMLVHKPGAVGNKITEDAPIEPRWVYPSSKAEAEEVIKTSARMPYAILRIAGVYDDHTAVPTLSQQMARIYEYDFQSYVFAGEPDAVDRGVGRLLHGQLVRTEDGPGAGGPHHPRVARVHGPVGPRPRLVLETVTVTGTENLLMAATLAEGETVIENAAREPEIADLARCLVAMGARIEGIGSGTLTIQGVPRLHGATYAVLPDRIELGTYAMAAAISRGELELLGGRLDLIGTLAEKLEEAGVAVQPGESGVVVRSNGAAPGGVDVMTQPYPGFPTDLQAQFMALMTMSNGVSRIRETIFENRYMHVAELARFGADIKVDGQLATVTGVPELKGAQVMATDLRASVSLVIAGLAARGETVVNRIYHLDRGFERLEEKLSRCGAEIERVTG